MTIKEAAEKTGLPECIIKDMVKKGNLVRSYGNYVSEKAVAEIMERRGIRCGGSKYGNQNIETRAYIRNKTVYEEGVC